MRGSAEDPRQKAKDLVELAFDDRTPDKERAIAAMKAVAVIRKYDLLSSPIDDILKIDNETVRAVGGIFEALTDTKLKRDVKTVFERARRSRRR